MRHVIYLLVGMAIVAILAAAVWLPDRTWFIAIVLIVGAYLLGRSVIEIVVDARRRARSGRDQP